MKLHHTCGGTGNAHSTQVGVLGSWLVGLCCPLRHLVVLHKAIPISSRRVIFDTLEGTLVEVYVDQHANVAHKQPVAVITPDVLEGTPVRSGPDAVTGNDSILLAAHFS